MYAISANNRLFVIVETTSIEPLTLNNVNKCQTSTRKCKRKRESKQVPKGSCLPDSVNVNVNVNPNVNLIVNVLVLVGDPQAGARQPYRVVARLAAAAVGAAAA